MSGTGPAGDNHSTWATTCAAWSGAARNFRKAWLRLVTTDLIYRAIAFVIMPPLVTGAVHWFVTWSGAVVITDTDLARFLLARPLGVTALLVVAVLLLNITVLQLACLVTIGLGAARGIRIGVGAALGHAARSAVAVLRLAAVIVVRVLALALPFAAAGGLAVWTLLRRHDINFYLAYRPPAFLAAAAIVVLLTASLAVLLTARLAAWSVALPIVLFERAGPAASLRSSRDRVGAGRPAAALVLVSWAIGSLLVLTGAVSAVRLLARQLAPVLTDNPVLLVVAVGAVAWLLAVVSLAVAVISSVFFALLAAWLYDRFGGGGDDVVARLATAAAQGSRQSRLSWRTAAWGLVAAIVVVSTISWMLLQALRTDRDVLVLAHRGAAGVAPENTMASFRRAIADGADYVELDVQETADGHVVVLHDSDLMRVARVKTKIWNARFEQVSGVDIGSWFAPQFAGERLPTLAQALDECRGKVRVAIELKTYGHGQRLEERVVEIVEAAGMTEHVVVMSLDHPTIARMRALRPSWTVGILAARALGDLTALDADFLAVNVALARRPLIRDAHRRGKRVFVWTVNDSGTMLRMLNIGADGLLTDEPARARAVVAFWQRTNAVERLGLGLIVRLGALPQVAARYQDQRP